MLGQHVYMRCLVDYFSPTGAINPGTYTAALSDGFFQGSERVREELEPRCNINEGFSARANLGGAEHGILRIYPLGQGNIAVSRAFSVKDKLTDGRNCTFTHTFLLSDQEARAFLANPGAAFERLNFDRYDAAVERIQASEDKRLRFDPRLGLPPAASYTPRRALFQACGFSKELFCSYISSLVQQIATGGKVAVILPDDKRNLWLSGGEDYAEQLIQATLTLLPDFIKQNLGVVSHWNNRIQDDLLRDIQLAFIHEPVHSELSESRAAILDLQNGTCINVPQTTEYANLLWAVLEDEAGRAGFDGFVSNLCGPALYSKRVDVDTLNAWAIMWVAEQNQFETEGPRGRAICAAAQTFAGALDFFPAVEKYLERALNREKRDHRSREVGRELVRLLKADERQHSYYEGAICCLIREVEKGFATTAAMDTLYEMLVKYGEANNPFLADYLTLICNETHNVTATPHQRIQLALAIWTRGGTPFAHGAGSLVDTWASAVIKEEAWKECAELSAALEKVLKGRADAGPLPDGFYGVLFRLLFSGNEAVAEQAWEILCQEMSRLKRTDAPAPVLQTYWQEFDRFFSHSEYGYRDCIFQQFFALAAYGSESLMQQCFKAFFSNGKSETLIRLEEQVYEHYLGLLLRLLEKKEPCCTENGVAQALISFEYRRMEAQREYVPPLKTLETLLGLLHGVSPRAGELLAAVYERHRTLGSEHRFLQTLDAPLVWTIYAYALSAGINVQTFQTWAAENCGERKKLLISAPKSLRTGPDARRLVGPYLDLFERELTTKNFHVPISEFYALLLREKEYCDQMEVNPAALGQALRERLSAALCRAETSELNRLTQYQVGEIHKVLGGKVTQGSPPQEIAIALLHEIDEIQSSRDLPRLDRLVHRQSGNQRELIKLRLDKRLEQTGKNRDVFWAGILMYSMLLGDEPGFRADEFARRIETGAEPGDAVWVSMALINLFHGQQLTCADTIAPLLIAWLEKVSAMDDQRFCNEKVSQEASRAAGQYGRQMKDAIRPNLSDVAPKWKQPYKPQSRSRKAGGLDLTDYLHIVAVYFAALLTIAVLLIPGLVLRQNFSVKAGAIYLLVLFAIILLAALTLWAVFMVKRRLRKKERRREAARAYERAAAPRIQENKKRARARKGR